MHNSNETKTKQFLNFCFSLISVCVGTFSSLQRQKFNTRIKIYFLQFYARLWKNYKCL